MSWTRPESVPFPSVWRRFERKDTTDPTVVRKFRVQDVTEDIVPQMIHQLKNAFLVDEPLCKATNFIKDSVSTEEFSELLKTTLKQNMTLICLEEGPDGELLKENGAPVLVGYNLLGIISKSEKKEPRQVKGHAFDIILKTLKFVTKQVDMFEKYNVDAYMTAMGLSVSGNYRGMTIGLEILKAREALCSATGIKAISTVFTATASQKLAARAGYEDLVDMTYEELKRQQPECSFPGILTTNIKYKAKMVES